MSLIQESVFLMGYADGIKKEYEEFIGFDAIGKRVHLSFYDGLEHNLKSFLDLADGRKVVVEERKDFDYPHEAYFEVDEVKFFMLVKKDQKEELEKLINESEADKFIDELEDL